MVEVNPFDWRWIDDLLGLLDENMGIAPDAVETDGESVWLRFDLTDEEGENDG